MIKVCKNNRSGMVYFKKVVDVTYVKKIHIGFVVLNFIKLGKKF